MQAFTAPAEWYSVALHEYAKVFVLTYPDEPYPAFAAADIWEKLQAASGMPRSHVESVVGIRDVEALPVAIHHYFMFPGQFKEMFAEEAKVLDGIFNG